MLAVGERAALAFNVDKIFWTWLIKKTKFNALTAKFCRLF